MKKNGFTLVELLAVIIILGFVAAIAVPKVIENIEKSKDIAYNQLLQNIEQTTELYIRNNKNSIQGIKIVGNQVSITLQDLVDKEGLKTPVIDPKIDKEISLSSTIKIFVKPRGKYNVEVDPFIYEEE